MPRHEAKFDKAINMSPEGALIKTPDTAADLMVGGKNSVAMARL